MKKAVGLGLFLLTQISWAAGQEGRILHFPEDSILGELYVQDDINLQNALWFNPFNEAECWDMLAQATGDVRIPAGKRVKLVVASKAWQKPEQLAPLKALAPNDLYALHLSDTWPPDKPANDKCIVYIQHLTGLRQLNLGDSAVTHSGLKLLSGMIRLERIYAPKGLSIGGLGTLTHMKSLTSIELVSDRISDKALMLLSELPHLKELILVSNRLTDAGLSHLANLTELEYLYLSTTDDNYSPEGYAHLASIPKLRNLWINTKHCSDEKIMQFAQHPTLEGISLHGESGITDRAVQSLSQVLNLKRLDVFNANLTNQSLAVLSSRQNLEELVLPSGFTDDGILQLTKLQWLKSLRVNTVSDSSLTDESLLEIAKIQHMEKLWISGTGFTDAGMSHLVKLKELKELLIGACTAVTNEGFAQLAGLANLEILYWNGDCPVTFMGLNRFGSHKNLKRFNCRNIRRGGVELNLSGMEKLEQLRIQMPADYNLKNRTSTYKDTFQDKDLACLASLGRLNSIQLYGGGISDEGLIYLKGLKDLNLLFLYGQSGITDEGLRYLTGLNQLCQLHIRGGHFTDQALEILSEMASLSIIELKSDTAISDQAIREFENKKKNLKKFNFTVSRGVY